MPDEAHSPTPPPSADLLAANTRLLALRQSLGVASSPPFVPDAAAGPVTPQPTPESACFPLPPHLGWESEAVTLAVRKVLIRQEKGLDTAANGHTFPSQPAHSAAPTTSNAAEENFLPTAPAQATIKLYPSLALAKLKQEQAACGRVWLL